jgi:transcriptional regulator with XRE-family HTH domain
MTNKNNLKEIRTKIGLSKAKLSDLANVSVATITRAESGNASLTEVSWSNIINGLNKGRDAEIFPSPISRADINK